jgi:aryl-alcohol dehydrogenase-like predicted oxidoreductase
VRTRALGKTGLRVSELSLGTWGLSGDAYGPVEAAEAERVIVRAAELGFSLFDTADAYAAGRMEVLLGKALARYPGATVVTKVGTDRATVPARKRFDKEHIVASCERSLRRLRPRERIDIYLLHNPSVEALEQGEATGAMEELARQGKIAHWGVSAGDVESGRAAIAMGAEVIEIAYNLFHSNELHRMGGEIMVNKVGVLARSTLAYGLLAGLWSKEKTFAEGDHRKDRWTAVELETRLAQLEGVRFLVRGDVHTMRAAAVRFVLANQLVSTAILGPRTVKQLDELVREVGAGPVYMSDEDLARLPRTLDRFGISM